MASDLDHSRLDDCLDLYLYTWKLFGDQTFTLAELTERLVKRNRGIEYATGEGEPERHLDFLVAYGLLKRVDDDHYRIQCTPEEDLETWQKRQAARTETIYRYVQRQRTNRSDENEGSDGEVLRRYGMTLIDVPIDNEVGIADLTERVAAASQNTSNIDGVMLRASAELSGHVQQLADGLCDRERVPDAEYPAFEKATADVVGEHKDDLEYQLYLRKTD